MKINRKILIAGTALCAALAVSPVMAEKQGPRLTKAVVTADGKKTATYKIKYDGKGRVKSIRVYTPSNTKGSYFAGTDYSYDGSGRIKKIKSTVSNPGTTVLSYTKGKLTKVQHPATYVLKEGDKKAEKKIIYSSVSYKKGQTVITGGLANNDNRYTRTYRKGVLTSEKIERGGIVQGTVKYFYNSNGTLKKTFSTVPAYDTKTHMPSFKNTVKYSYKYAEKYGRKVPVMVSSSAGKEKIKLSYSSGKSVKSQQNMLIGRDTGYSGLYSLIACSESQICRTIAVNTTVKKNSKK